MSKINGIWSNFTKNPLPVLIFLLDYTLSYKDRYQC